MTIELLTEVQHNYLKKIQENNPKLTFQNEGYQYIKDLSESDKEAIKEVEEILEKSIVGFHEFNNFKIRPNGDIVVRFQYNYGADEEGARSFKGVGYLGMNELLNGFNNKDKN